MKIVVCVKQVPDPNSVDVNPVTGAIDEERLIYVVNPPDKCAVEEAVRIKEWLGEGEVTAITLGPPRAEEALRQCLALGADGALRLWDRDMESLDALSIALVLAEAIKGMGYDLILCGAESADRGSGQVGAAIAELLGLPQVCGITELKLEPEGRSATVQRKLERGQREVVECPLPALFTVDASLNEPRYPSLPCYIEALMREVPAIDLQALGMRRGSLRIDGAPQILGMSPPRPRPKKVFTPDSKLSAFQRIDAILSGGLVERKGTLIQGSPQKLAERIVRFLVERGIIGS
ncbi:MAG: electron transfer flavoprotein subunit beta/FixA family protein [Dehalococcoidia bacterium]